MKKNNVIVNVTLDLEEMCLVSIHDGHLSDSQKKIIHKILRKPRSGRNPQVNHKYEAGHGEQADHQVLESQNW
jgi:hypothetical protein